MILVTLADIREQSPCGRGWASLLQAKKKIDVDTPFPVADVIMINGVADALWVLEKLGGDEGKRVCQEFGLWCADTVKHLMKDSPSRNALDIKRQWLDGKVSDADLLAAWSAAVGVAASATVNTAASDAAWAAARAASLNTSWAHSMEAARAAASATGEYGIEKVQALKLLQLVGYVAPRPQKVAEPTPKPKQPAVIEKASVPDEASALAAEEDAVIEEVSVLEEGDKPEWAVEAVPSDQPPHPSVPEWAVIPEPALEPEMAPEFEKASGTVQKAKANGKVRKFRF